MLKITENKILEAYDAFELTESELIELYSEGYISENTMDQLIEMGVFDELIMESNHLKSFGKSLVSGAAKLGAYGAPGAAGALGGAALGSVVGGPLGGALGAGAAKKSGHFRRFEAKIDNWTHDSHFRDHHRNELKKAIKNKDSKKAAFHRANMLKHQERMQKHLELNRGSKYDMKNYDDNGDEIK